MPPGTCNYTNGSTYMGSWKDGKACGTGTQTFGNGDRYDGEWTDGMLNGKVSCARSHLTYAVVNFQQGRVLPELQSIPLKFLWRSLELIRRFAG